MNRKALDSGSSPLGFVRSGTTWLKVFLVKAGSGVVRDEVPSCPASVREMRLALRQNGVIRSVRGDEGWEMAEDCTFSSPSTVSSVVQGGQLERSVGLEDGGGSFLVRGAGSERLIGSPRPQWIQRVNPIP